jgi:hypothetical protein
MIKDFKNENGKWVRTKYVDGKPFHTWLGSKWNNVTARCKEGGSEQLRNPAYVGVYHTFRGFDDFAEWSVLQKGYGRDWQLDKDILRKGCKVYSKDTCVFVPKCINVFLTSRKSQRGATPIGVRLEASGMYSANCKDGHGKGVYLGRFKDAEQAFFKYKMFKEGVAKQIANRWQSEIDPRVYHALMTLNVEITD